MRGVRDNENPELISETEATEEMLTNKVVKVGKEVIRPYRGKDSLPKEILDKKGNVIKRGEPMHILARCGQYNYKLIRIYRARGIKHSLVRTLKPKSRPEDSLLVQQLIAAGLMEK